MSTLLENTIDKTGIQIAGIINLPNKIVEVYGEIHGEKNPFCEEIIAKKLTSDYTVFCEHSTLLCYVKEDEHHLFKAVTGSEYVFFNKATENIPICFDNRLENGLPSAIEETGIRTFFSSDSKSFTISYFRIVIVRLDEIINILAQSSPIFKMFYNDEYNEIMSYINRQFDLIVKSADRGVKFIKGKNFFIENTDNLQIIMRIGMCLIDNIKKLCSMFVDVNLFLVVAKSSAKKIVVFTGASHAYRLLKIMLSSRSDILIDISKELLPFVQATPIGSPDRELQFLKLLYNKI